MKKILVSLILLIGIQFANTSCSNYLDIVPEGIESMDHAFSNRAYSYRFLTTCYTYLPQFNNVDASPGFLAGDEFWTYPPGPQPVLGMNCWGIGRGSQNNNEPHMDYWNGGNGGHNLWIGIRDCNIFLENIHKPLDLDEYEKVQWIAEVKFLKAFYHFYLMQLYGPIPIMDINIEVNESVAGVRKHRDPFDDVTNYVVALLDDCIEDLPLKIYNEGTELGRATQAIALAVKAQVLLFAASPLMNGNPDYVSVTDNRGTKLFSQEYDATKWQKAADAALAAIKKAHEADHQLHKFELNIDISDTTRTILGINGAVTERWNDEIIWGCSRGTIGLQTLSMPKLSSLNNHWAARGALAPTLTVAEQFYSNNGVPLDEDNGRFWTQNYLKRYDVVDIPDEGGNKYILDVGEQTATLHLNRELRFYANLFFDRSRTYMSSSENDSDKSNNIHMLAGEDSGMKGTSDYSITGYLPRKLVNMKSELTKTTWVPYNYAFPIIRLADLYLMYAEALNESLAVPNDSVYIYLDEIRERAGLKGVVDSWRVHSTNPEAPANKDDMREIIRAERLNELALEGKRFWDLRRWKIEQPSEVRGWGVTATTANEFYRVTRLFERPRYYYRDYLWPIRISAIEKNPNLLQNPGWK